MALGKNLRVSASVERIWPEDKRNVGSLIFLNHHFLEIYTRLPGVHPYAMAQSIQRYVQGNNPWL